MLLFWFFIISYMFPYIIYSCSTYINCSALASCLFFNWTDFTVANGLNKKKMVHSLKVVSEKKLLGYLFGICQHNCTYIWSLIVETQKPRTVIIKLEFCSLSEMVHQYPSINTSITSTLNNSLKIQLREFQLFQEKYFF